MSVGFIPTAAVASGRPGAAKVWALTRREATKLAAFPAAASLLAACQPASQPGAPAGGGPAARTPVTIEVLTRSGITNPTGHSQHSCRRSQRRARRLRSCAPPGNGRS
jgi:hypothetical protein